MHATSLQIAHTEHLFGALHSSIFRFSLFARLYTTYILCVAFNYMHIYAFIVPYMHKNAFKCILAYVCTCMYIFTHIYAYLHTFIYEGTT